MSDSLVVLGGGVIGLSIAYYVSLAEPDRQVIIVDSEKSLLLSASGFSGGYIVRDWFSLSVLPLAELSFQLHKELAESHGGRHKWGYSESTAYSVVMELAESEQSATGKRVARGEDWLLHGTSRAEVAKKYISMTSVQGHKEGDGRGRDILLRDDGSPIWVNIPSRGTFEKISSPSGCAQVEPRQLCEWLIQQCQQNGVEFCLGTQTVGSVKDGHGHVHGLRVERQIDDQRPQQTVISCKDVVISAGCWTPRVFEALVGEKMSTGISPLPGYSRVVRSPRFNRPIVEINDVGEEIEMAHAVFCPPTSDWTYSPECMARFTRDGRPEIFVAGLNDEMITLPELAGDTKNLMERSKLEDLKKATITLAGSYQGGSVFEDDLELVREGLCFRPVSENGLPIITRVNGMSTTAGGSLYVASGHGPWGITLSLGTGFVVSELLQGLEPSASVKDFGLRNYQKDTFSRAHL